MNSSELLYEDSPEREESAIRAAFIRENQEVLAELLTFLDFAEGLTIAFVELNFSPDLEFWKAMVLEHPQHRELQFVVMDFSDRPDLRFLKDEILQKLTQEELQPNKKLVLVITGLARAIGTDLQGEYPPVLQDLNFVRDAYSKAVPHPLLFVLPDYAITRLAKYAPDFWAWKSGIFRFKSSWQVLPQSQERLQSQIDEWQQRGDPKDQAESQERIDLLQARLMDLKPSGQTTGITDHSACSEVEFQLGKAYVSLKDFQRGEYHLSMSLNSYELIEKLDNHAQLHYQLGRANYGLKRYDKAMTFYQQAIQLDPVYAAPHCGLGNVYRESKRYDEAITSYQQAIQLDPTVAAHHYGLGNVYRDLKRYDEAIQTFKNIIERDPTYAPAYKALSDLYSEDIEDYQSAIEVYQEAIDSITDSSELFLFNNLGWLYVLVGNLAEYYSCRSSSQKQSHFEICCLKSQQD